MKQKKWTWTDRIKKYKSPKRKRMRTIPHTIKNINRRLQKNIHETQKMDMDRSYQQIQISQTKTNAHHTTTHSDNIHFFVFV